MDRTVLLEGLSDDEPARVAGLTHADPHHVLGAHPVASGIVVRAYRPDARTLRIVPDDPAIAPRDAEPLGPEGLFAAHFAGVREVFPYRLEVHDFHGNTRAVRCAYAFVPTLGELDLHLVVEGRHRRLYEKLGAHVQTLNGVPGASFSVWAPNAQRLSVVGDWNHWDGRYHAMRRMGATGVWELFVPEIEPGARYKYEVIGADGERVLKVDPFAFQTELRPSTAAVVRGPLTTAWTDEAWMQARRASEPLRSALSIYEVHLGSWMRVPEEHDRWLTYRELAQKLGDYVSRMGFTHVELMPIAEHPFDGSWGYQVTGYFAPTSRFGTPDDFRYFVDAMHRRGIGVILDWVPAHFPKDRHALARFDGTALYEHADPRQGEHPDWGTLVFNLGRNEVRNFLLANALYWLDVFHIDALRVDAVASMLYLDYSRKADQWVPNKHGGRENLESIAFLKELNELVHGEYKGAMVLAEESTAWPAVSRPTYVGGLGFTFKWNMGWMHDTLAFFAQDPVFRRYHHSQLTFGLWYAYTENFVLPLSHDEVVHLKGSLLTKMPGDEWRRFANLRAMFGYMWCHPGKKLLFMGGEFGQTTEWREDRSLEWHQLEQPLHAGVSRLVRDLNALYRSHDALWEADIDPSGFQWIVVNDAEQSVAAFARYNRDRSRHVVVALNATPVVRHGYRLGVPTRGYHRELLNTDAEPYGGSNVGNHGGREAYEAAAHGMPFTLEVTLPPLSVVIFEGPPLDEDTDAEPRELADAG